MSVPGLAEQRSPNQQPYPTYAPHAANLNASPINDLDKFRQHQIEAEEFLKQFKNTQLEKNVALSDEKKKDREMLKNYDPWGKGSGGPPDDARRKKWFVDTKETRTLMPNEKPNECANPNAYYLKFGSPGHGAPIRNEYGDVITDVRGVQEIRFKTQGPVDYAQPYRYLGDRTQQQAYREELDKMVSQKALDDQRKRVSDLKSDMNYLQHNPFAKLGTREMPQRVAPPSSSTAQQTESPNQGADNGQWPRYHPYGKQGAGAPLRDEHGNIITTLSKGPVEGEPKKIAAKMVYVGELQKNLEEQRWNRYLEKEYAHAPAGDFASKMMEGKVGKPKRDPVTGLLLAQPLPQSDISRYLNPGVKPDPDLQTELDRLSFERAMLREMERREAMQDDFGQDTSFGRPGGGAPNIDGNKKRKLDQVLYRASQDKNAFYKTSEVVEPIPTDLIPPVLQPPAGGAVTQDVGPNGESTRLNYVRNNVNSKHSNFYEFMPLKQPYQPRSPRDPFVKIAQYKLNAPFATPD